MTRGSAIFVVAVVGTCFAAARGAAQTTPKLPEAYVSVKGGLAPVGSLNADTEGASLGMGDDGMPIEFPSHQGESALNVAFAAEVGYLFSLHPYLALGPALGVHTWQSNAGKSAGEGGSTGLDLSLVPQARLPLSDTFELYVSLPLGMTLSLLGEYKVWVEQPNHDWGTANDVDPTYGWSFGAYVGARLLIEGNFGVLTELGYQRYAFTHRVEFQVLESKDMMGTGTTLDLALVTQQLRWNVGVFF
ncbi:MAG TPA: hypothetical protein VJV78_48880 [Polyangiales bacterium]|nr:hypothetical protein [Polyangiales bacterium]